MICDSSSSRPLPLLPVVMLLAWHAAMAGHERSLAGQRSAGKVDLSQPDKHEATTGITNS